MIYQALPDLQQPILADPLLLYYPYEGHGPFRVLPDQLTIATVIDASGTEAQLDFHLTFVRGQFPGRPPQPHGRLAFGVRPHFALAAALDLARQHDPTATVAPLHLRQGTLRLIPLNSTVEIPSELLEPVALQWVGAEVLQIQLTLSPTAATFLRDALQGELLPLTAYVEAEYQGIAPRLPVEVTVLPGQLLAELLAAADAERRLPRAAIVRAVLYQLDQPSADAPFTITGTLPDDDQADFAEALTDRLVARLGCFVPAPEIMQGAYVQLNPWDDTVETEFTWDLREPTLTTRRVGLTLDPFAAAQQMIQAYGFDSVYTERIVPMLPTGIHQLYISTNFPTGIEDVTATGVQVRVPPYPPYRYHEIVQELDELEGVDEQTMLLRLSFREALGYFYTTYLVMNSAEGSTIVRGAEQWHEQVTLRLTTADYPVQLATLTATSALLALAALDSVLHWQEGKVRNEKPFAFGEKPRVTLLLPPSAEDAGITLRATSRETGAVLTLSDLPFQDTRIGRYSFPTYGSHAVEITCLFGPAQPLTVSDEITHVTVELLPEGSADLPENRTILHFTPEQPRKEWQWFAESPFAGGYRYRVQHAQHPMPDTWSAVQSPFDPLTIEIGATAMDELLPGDRRFADLIYYPDPDDTERFFYLPGAPLPVLNPQGRPMVSLLIAGSNGFLQLDVRWQAPADQLDALRHDILAQQPALDPRLLRLSFAPVTVEQIALLLTTGRHASADGEGDDEEVTVLATSQSSGVPPYNGLFSVAVNAEQQDLVIGALHQREGLLRVRYAATRAATVSVTVALEGDITAALTELSPAATLEECKAWVSAALAQAMLQQTRTGPAHVPTDLWQRTEAAAMTQAAEWLHRRLQQAPLAPTGPRMIRGNMQNSSTLAVTATLSDTLAVPVQRTADISTWFADGSGDDHIRIVG